MSQIENGFCTFLKNIYYVRFLILTPQINRSWPPLEQMALFWRLTLLSSLLLIRKHTASRLRQWQHEQAIDSTNTATTGTLTWRANTTNFVLPEECSAVSEECMDQLISVADDAHNANVSDVEKDSSLYNFCGTECGKK